VRGRERSRRPEDILAESQRSAAEGAVELMYLGQNVNAYGKKEQTFGGFAGILRQAQVIDGVERIRFMTSHPKDFTQEIIDAIADCPKVARHIHLPVQSGSSRILSRMNRGYTREDYLGLVDEIRKCIPGIAITTDIIVGFPGETDEDMRDTMDLLNEIGFNSAFTFMYSPRQGTSAALLPEQIPLREKKTRLQAVMDIQAANSLRLHQALVGSDLRVLAESWEDGMLTGRAEGNQLIHYLGEADGIGRFQQVRVTDAQTWTLKGEICGNDRI